MNGKRVADTYIVSLNPEFKKNILRNFRAENSATWVRQYTDELWDPAFHTLTCAQYGAYRRLLMMLARSKGCVRSGNIHTCRKELKSFGITDHLLEQIRTKVKVLDISLVTDDGEIKDLPWD